MQLPLDRLTLHPDCQARDATDSAYAAEIAEYLKTRDSAGRPRQTKPVEAVQQGDTFYLWDGFHRLEGHRQAGRKTILVSVRPGTIRDAILLATSANRDHGLRRTNADKRRAVLLLLTDEEWGEWPDLRVAEHCGVSRHLVSNLREEIRKSDRADRKKGCPKDIKGQGESEKRKWIDEQARKRKPRAKPFRDMTAAEQAAQTAAEQAACRAQWGKELLALLGEAERRCLNLGESHAVVLRYVRVAQDEAGKAE